MLEKVPGKMFRSYKRHSANEVLTLPIRRLECFEKLRTSLDFFGDFAENKMQSFSLILNNKTNK